MFTVSISREESVVSLMPEGRLDTLNSAVFAAEMQQLHEEEYILVDFTRCDYLSSSGIRSLMTAARQLGARGGALMLVCLPAEVFQVIEMTGLQSVFPIFPDAGSARKEIQRLKRRAGQCTEITIDGCQLEVQQLDSPDKQAFRWGRAGLAGYNELGISVGIGSPAETLLEDENSRGYFITLGNSAGFVPFDKNLPPEFRIVRDPSGAAIFLHWALSFGSSPESRVKLLGPSEITLADWLDRLVQVPPLTDPGKMKTFVIAESGNGQASLSVGYTPTAQLGSSIGGARFLVNRLPEPGMGESVTDYAARVLTIENTEGVEALDGAAVLVNPVAWLFRSDHAEDAEGQRIVVETSEDFVFEPYKAFLTRRLYADSARVVVKPLHGGYSAQTFQVESFDAAGRKLRPTVLKIANRAIISREADRCQRFALPYIMNNSAIVLGTAFFCDTGALRYNFVGIGGEQSRLQWLAHYFHSWNARELEPLFDKIFTQILKPWYGQPVREDIYPYRDQDPTLTFFSGLCDTAEEVLGIGSDEPLFRVEETGEMRTTRTGS